MALLESELKIVTIDDLFGLHLAIPEYQRPYNWTTASTYTLLKDTYEAYRERLEEYRLGSVILHKKNDTYFIVDGQQRLTTLAILLHCLDKAEESIGLLEEEYSTLSTNAIIRNAELLEKKIADFETEELARFKDYIKEKCTVVQIVTDDEQEAFQFFDSQNSRGKELAPHDLLKSYHLREMNEEEESIKTKIINRWENQHQKRLEELFKDYLFPLTQWYKWRSGLGYSTEKIGTFKGIKPNNLFNYAIYQKAANLFIEQMNQNGSVEIFASKTLNQFQLTQPLIAGKRFFTYTLHYADLQEKVRKRIHDFHRDGEIPKRGSGDVYIRKLYENGLLFFADRFGLESLDESVMKQFYTWSYSLRLVMHAVYPETINKYAIGKHDRINKNLDLFTRISEMQEPEELNLIIFDKVDEEKVKGNIKKYPAVWEFLRKENRW